MTSRKKSRILSVVFLILLSGVLIGFMSTQEVNAFPEMITDSFEWDTIQTLYWVLYDTNGLGDFDINNGVLNYTSVQAFGDRVFENMEDMIWDSYKDAGLSQTMDDGISNTFGVGNTETVYQNIGVNVTARTYVYNFTANCRSGWEQNSEWRILVQFANGTYYYSASSTTSNDITLDWGYSAEIIYYGFQMKADVSGGSPPFVTFDDWTLEGLVSFTAGNDQMKREMEVEEEELYLETVLKVIEINDGFFELQLLDSGSEEVIHIGVNSSFAFCRLEHDNIRYIDVELPLSENIEGMYIKWIFEIDENKNFTWTITELQNSSNIILGYSNSDSRLPRASAFLFLEIQDWTSPDYENNNAHIEMQYIKTYFFPSPVPRETTTETTYTMREDSYQEITVLDTGTADGVYHGYRIFYPDLQNMAFKWRLWSSTYPLSDVSQFHFMINAIYDDGTEQPFFWVKVQYRSGAIGTRIQVWHKDWGSTVNTDYGAGVEMDVGVSFNRDSDGQYKLKIYETLQDDYDFSIISDGIHDSEIAPDTDKKLVGFTALHRHWTQIVRSADTTQDLEDYSVTYGQDFEVPEVTFPTVISASNPEVGTEGIPWFLYPIIFIVTLAITIFVGVVDFINVIIFQPIMNWLLTVLPLLIEVIITWLISTAEVILTLILTALQTLATAILTIIITLFNDIMTFFGISLTWAQFIEFILEIPSLLVSFLGLGVYFFYFIDFFLSQIFIIFAIVEPFFTPFFYYFEKYWQIALLWIVLLIGAISLQQKSIDPIISLGRGLFSVVMAVVGFFRWIGELALWFISFIAGLIRG